MEVTLTILALSVVATALAFTGEPTVAIIVTARLPVVVGALTCVIFFLTLMDLQLRLAVQSASAPRRGGRARAF
jgi:hypothetical protein